MTANGTEPHRHAAPAPPGPLIAALREGAAWLREHRPVVPELIHRHHYHPVHVSYLPASVALPEPLRPVALSERGASAVILKCWCTRKGQYTFVLLPGHVRLEEIVTAESPGLLNLATVRKILKDTDPEEANAK